MEITKEQSQDKLFMINDVLNPQKWRKRSIRPGGRRPSVQGYEFSSGSCKLVITYLTLTVLRRDNFTCRYCGLQGKVFLLKNITSGNNLRVPRLQVYGYRKSKSGGLMPVLLTIDHIIPISKGGRKKASNNLQTLCSECNNKKADQIEGEIQCLD